MADKQEKVIVTFDHEVEGLDALKAAVKLLENYDDVIQDATKSEEERQEAMQRSGIVVDSMNKALNTQIDKEKKLSNEYENTKKKLEELRKEQEKSPNKKIEAEITRLEKALEKQSAALTKQKSVVTEAQNANNKASEITKKQTKNVDELEKEIRQLIEQQKNLNKSTKDWEKSFFDLGDKIKQKQKELENLKNGTQANVKSNNVFGQSLGMVFMKAHAAIEVFRSMYEALSGIVGKVIEVGSEFERYQAALSNVYKSTERANVALMGIAQVAKTTPFSVRELADAFVKFRVGRGIELTEQQMRRIGDLASALGKPFGQLSEAILDVNNTERWTELGLKVKTEGSKISGTFQGVTKTFDRTEKGAIAMVEAFAQLDGIQGAMAAQSKTLGGSLSNLEDAMHLLYKSLADRLSPSIIASTKHFTQWTDSIRESLDAMGQIDRAAKNIGADRFEMSKFFTTDDPAEFLKQIGLLFVSPTLEGNQNKRLEKFVSDVNKITSEIFKFTTEEEFKKANQEIIKLIEEAEKQAERIRKEGTTHQKTFVEQDFLLQTEIIGEAINKLEIARNEFINRVTIEAAEDAKKLIEMQDLIDSLRLKLRQARLDTFKLTDEEINIRNIEQFASQVKKQLAIDIDELRLENKKAIRKIEDDAAEGKLKAERRNEAIMLQNAVTQQQINNMRLQSDIEIAQKRAEVEENYWADVKETMEKALKDSMSNAQSRLEAAKKMQETLKEVSQVSPTELDPDEIQKQLATFKALADARILIASEEIEKSGKNRVSKEKEITKQTEKITRESLEKQLQLLESLGLQYTNQYRELYLALQNFNKDASDRNAENLKQTVDGYISIAQTIINTISQIYDAFNAKQEQSLDKQIELQRKRVDDAERIAEKGNANLLRQEQERLQKLEKERERSAQRQQAIAATEAVANSIVAITQAATAPPPFNIAAIATLVAAIGAGIVSVTGLVSRAFKDGEVDIEGPGTTTSDSIFARISRGESVVNAESTKHSKRALTLINEGKLNDNLIFRALDAYEKSFSFELPQTPKISENQKNDFNEPSYIKEMMSSLKENRQINASIIDKMAQIIAPNVNFSITKEGITSAVKQVEIEKNTHNSRG